MKKYLIKNTGETCQIAYPIDNNTVIVYIIGSASFSMSGTITQPLYKTVSLTDLIKF